MSRRAVFFDRDGVLNRPLFREGRSFAPRRLSDFDLYPEAAPAVSKARAAGFLAIVTTNQPDVGAGLVDRSVIEAMHARLRLATEIDDVEVCFDTRTQAGRRRKPRPGMLLDAAAQWGVDLAASAMIGDRAGDVEAGRAAGCGAVLFVDRAYAAEPAPTAQDATVADVAEAVDWIIRWSATTSSRLEASA